MLPPLRDYQQTAVADVFSAPGHVCLVAPTGSGKTRMGVAVLSEITDRSVWVVHRRELLQQARDVLDAAGLLHRVTPITAQSSERPRASVVLYDECHHYAADEWSAIADTYPDAWRIGLTATPERADGRALGSLFDRMVVAAKYSDLIRDGHLVPCRILRPESGLERGLALDPVDAYRKHAADRSGFVFVPRIDEARALAERFTAAGIPTAAIDAGTPEAERDAAISALRSGDLRLLTNVYALTEGVDVPTASVCILARAVGHVSQYLQIAGRVLRTAPGKTDALLIDLPGVSHEFGSPTEDRIYSLDGVGIRLASASVTTCLHCGASYETGPLACPECGFQKPTEDYKPLLIYNAELREVYLGAATADDAKHREYARLRSVQRAKSWSLDWVAREYRRLFGCAPDFGDVPAEERREYFAQMREHAAERGFKPGFAAARYRNLFGEWPPRAWSYSPTPPTQPELRP